MRERLIPLLRGWPLQHLLLNSLSNLGGASHSLSVPLCSPCCTRHKAQAGRVDCCWSDLGICLASLYCLHSWKVAVKELWALLSLRTDGCRVGAGAQGRHLCGSPGVSLHGTGTLVLSRALVGRWTAQSAAAGVRVALVNKPESGSAGTEKLLGFFHS